jgi:hypothetical protein
MAGDVCRNADEMEVQSGRDCMRMVSNLSRGSIENYRISHPRILKI